MAKITHVFLFLVISMYFCTTGCSKKVSVSDDRSSSSISMTTLNFQQWQQELSKYKSKILVVDAWATWCHSCLERFPHMLTLAEKYRDKDVQFVSLNLDDKNSPEDLELANKFLKSVKADIPNYFMNENMLDAFEKLDFLSIPVVQIYDAHGKKRFQLSGDNPNNQFTDKDVESAIVSLLANG